MIEELLPHLYRIEVPLPGSPLKALNVYVVMGGDRILIIDTGMNRDECRTALLNALDSLGVDLAIADFFITHLHADHIGLLGKFVTDTSLAFCGDAERSYILYQQTSPQEMLDISLSKYRENGFPEVELRESLALHPGIKYGIGKLPNFIGLRDGDSLEYGEYRFVALQTPGHSPGHTCLYEPDKGVLISGDHVLDDITPNITWWPKFEDSLREYLRSLDRLAGLRVDHVLPGHRRVFRDLHGRIDQLQHHHRQRLREAHNAVEGGAQSIWDIAPFLSWHSGFGSWEEFPLEQKWFAMGETLAHVRLLEEKGDVVKRMEHGQALYTNGM